MTTVDRRALMIGGAVLLSGGRAAARPAEDDEPDPIAEFTGRAKSNPKYVGPGRVKVTGVVRVPAEHKLRAVSVRRQTDEQLRSNGVYVVGNATVDEKASPPAWTVEFTDVDAGAYWFDFQVMFTAPDGTDLTYDGTEKRRLGVPEGPK